jgi:hypothetical protein
MSLQPGCRFVVAPHFHLAADWPRRLLVAAGVEEAGGRFLPRRPWRPPAPDELALLVWAAEGPLPPEELEDCVCLFQLPGHLRSGWWKLLEQAAGSLGDGRLPGFEAFVSQVAEFLAFKALPVPEGARCDMVVSDPGQRLVPGGLRWGVPPRPQLWGGINLGDEETSVVLVLRGCSDYPPVRLVLGPGEGCRLPRGGLILDSDLEGKQGPDVLLLISHERDYST